VLLWQAILSIITVYGLRDSQPQQYKLPLCQTLNSNDRQYSLPQQYKLPLCQTLNSNDRQYSLPYCLSLLF
jgi:hypothetical protein